MTDESALISQVKFQVRKLKLCGFNPSGVSDEEIMISNLPLLFADGYPACLEKFTLVSMLFLVIKFDGEHVCVGNSRLTDLQNR
jgi:hypothetical protein